MLLAKVKDTGAAWWPNAPLPNRGPLVAVMSQHAPGIGVATPPVWHAQL